MFDEWEVYSYSFSLYLFDHRNPNFIYLRSFEMKQQQTYRGQGGTLDGWELVGWSLSVHDQRSVNQERKKKREGEGERKHTMLKNKDDVAIKTKWLHHRRSCIGARQRCIVEKGRLSYRCFKRWTPGLILVLGTCVMAGSKSCSPSLGTLL